MVGHRASPMRGMDLGQTLVLVLVFLLLMMVDPLCIVNILKLIIVMM